MEAERSEWRRRSEEEGWSPLPSESVSESESGGGGGWCWWWIDEIIFFFCLLLGPPISATCELC